MAQRTIGSKYWPLNLALACFFLIWVGFEDGIVGI